MVEVKYGILMTISTQQDLGSELMDADGEVVRFFSVDDAVGAAEKHSKEPLFIRDWLYDIVHVYERSRFGTVIESYSSVPAFHRIFPAP
jgi:hypothetical protein